jgi:hypothetical protein
MQSLLSSVCGAEMLVFHKVVEYVNALSEVIPLFPKTEWDVIPYNLCHFFDFFFFHIFIHIYMIMKQNNKSFKIYLKCVGLPIDIVC